MTDLTDLLKTCLSFALIIGQCLAFVLLDPIHGYEWERELPSVTQVKQVDGFTPLSLPDSILRHLPK